MPTITFRGTFIRFVDLRFDTKSKSVYTKINFTAVYSKPVRDELEWSELPDGMASANLDGEYTATEFTLMPNGLENAAFTLEAKDMSGFSVHRVTSDDDKEKTEEELRFQVLTPDEHAASKLAKYLKVVGHGAAQLRVKYNAQSVLENEAADEKQDRLISPEQAADTAAASDGPTLLPSGRGTGRSKTRGDKVN
jgi:hypothetical protein